MFARPTSHSAALGPGCAGPSLAVPTSAVLEAAPRTAEQRPLSGAPAFAVDPQGSAGEPRKHTQNPYVTGTSVLAFVYKDGVMVACDTLGSYGSTKRYKSLQRIFKVNDSCLVAAAGEISDFQYLQRLLGELVTEDYCCDDGVSLSPAEVYSYLNRVLYNRRNRFDPLWNSLVVAGQQQGRPFLGMVGMVGTCYADTTVATGFGQHLARPLFREVDTTALDEAAAAELMSKALRVCYYRDKQSINKFQVARVTGAGVAVSEPFALDTQWEFKSFVSPTASAVGSW